MTEKESLQQKLAAAEKKLRQLQNRQKILLNKMRNEEYRARTRRLVVHGANLESVFPTVTAMSAEDTLAFLSALARLPGARELAETPPRDGGAK